MSRVAQVHTIVHAHQAGQHLRFDCEAHGLRVAFLDLGNQHLLEQAVAHRAYTGLDCRHCGLGDHVAEHCQQTRVELVALVNLETFVSFGFEPGQRCEYLVLEIRDLVLPSVRITVYNHCVD